MENVDTNGLTEAQFLAEYKQKDYPKPSLTADMAVFRPVGGPEGEWEVLLIRRGGHPFLGCWAFPGGFVEPGEDADQAAVRELQEETGLVDVSLEQFGLYSTPGRDPRAWTASEAYLGVVNKNAQACAGDDAADAKWFSLSLSEIDQTGTYRLAATAAEDELLVEFSVSPRMFGSCKASVTRAEGFAFDHGRILADAYLALQGTINCD